MHKVEPDEYKVESAFTQHEHRLIPNILDRIVIGINVLTKFDFIISGPLPRITNSKMLYIIIQVYVYLQPKGLFRKLFIWENIFIA